MGDVHVFHPDRCDVLFGQNRSLWGLEQEFPTDGPSQLRSSLKLFFNFNFLFSRREDEISQGTSESSKGVSEDWGGGGGGGVEKGFKGKALGVTNHILVTPPCAQAGKIIGHQWVLI